MVKRNSDPRPSAMTTALASGVSVGRVQGGSASGLSGGWKGSAARLPVAGSSNSTLPLATGTTRFFPQTIAAAAAVPSSGSLTATGAEPDAALYAKSWPPACVSVQAIKGGAWSSSIGQIEPALSFDSENAAASTALVGNEAGFKVNT